MDAPKFELFEGVELPKRAAFGSSAPRETQYPLDQMGIGHMFTVPVEGKEGQSTKSKDGTVTPLTLEEDTLRKARQKQSQIAALAKRRGISIQSRFIVDGANLHPNFAGQKNFVAVWRVEPQDADPEQPEDATDGNEGIELN